MSKIKSPWKWWQNKLKNPEIVITSDQDRASTITQSSLIVQHSLNSNQSEEIASTTSIISKPYVLKDINQDTSSTIVNNAESNVKTASSSLSMRVPESKSPETNNIRFSGIKVKPNKQH